MVFALFGMAGGWLLGQLAVGEGLYRTARGEIRSSFAELSGNPEAIAADPAPTPIPCPGCADARAAAERLRSARYDRAGDEFRSIEPVELAYPPIYESLDDYGAEPIPGYPAPPATRMSRALPPRVEQVGNSRLVTLPADSVPTAPEPPIAIRIPPAQPSEQ